MAFMAFIVHEEICVSNKSSPDDRFWNFHLVSARPTLTPWLEPHWANVRVGYEADARGDNQPTACTTSTYSYSFWKVTYTV
jgi:hypothetical protein